MRITIGNNVTVKQKDNSLQVQYYQDFTEVESRDITVGRSQKADEIHVITADASIDFSLEEVEQILPSLLSILIRSKNDAIQGMIDDM